MLSSSRSPQVRARRPQDTSQGCHGYTAHLCIKEESPQFIGHSNVEVENDNTANYSKHTCWRGEGTGALRESPEMSIKDTPMGEQSGVTYTEEGI